MLSYKIFDVSKFSVLLLFFSVWHMNSGFIFWTMRIYNSLFINVGCLEAKFFAYSCISAINGEIVIWVTQFLMIRIFLSSGSYFFLSGCSCNVRSASFPDQRVNDYAARCCEYLKLHLKWSTLNFSTDLSGCSFPCTVVYDWPDCLSCFRISPFHSLDCLSCFRITWITITFST